MKQYIVIATKLTIRNAPSIEADAKDYLNNGDIIDGVRKSSDGKWIEFQRITGSKIQKGWTSLKYLQGLENEPLVLNEDLPWMKIAIREMGIREFYGNEDNPRINQYLKSIEKLDAELQRNDETPWCAAFVNWCIEKSGFEGTNLALAKHWLHWGEKLEKPVRGCVVVLRRGNGGHVGFFVKESATAIFLLGGNQNDEVNIKAFSKDNLVGYRLLKFPLKKD